MLQGTYCSFTSNRGKVLQKFVQGLAAFEVIQEGLEGNARTTKNRCPPENIRVADNHFVT